ncbi:hypothetical protein FH5_05376 [Priestia endophytica]|nr:hypothetical protein FH5_05376 [Priestia endophytica]
MKILLKFKAILMFKTPLFFQYCFMYEENGGEYFGAKCKQVPAEA